MPRRILFGKSRDIEKWCRNNGKAMPTLLDLALARSESNKRNKRERRK